MRENQSKSSRPKSSDKNTSKKEEDVPLDEIVEKVSSYFKKFDHFKKYEKDIKKKYQKYYKTTEALPDCWSHDFINKAWRKTEKMHEFTGRKKCWSLAILLQVMKRSLGYDENEREAQTDVKKESPQSGGDPSANKPVHNPSEPVYIRIPFSEMIDGKKCYRSDTDAKNKESKFSETDEKNKESKASETDEKNKESKFSEKVAMDNTESPKNKEFKLIDKVPSPTQILQNNFYITLYDNQTRNAAWVYEILNKSTLANKVVNKRTDFKQDESVHKDFRTPDSLEPYSGTGYDRGHLAAAANHKWCQQAYDDTYLLSNVIPQQRGFNSGIWLELEEYCREIAMTEEVHNVHVYTGPLYLSKDKKSEANNDQNKSKNHVEYKKILKNNNNKKKKVNVDQNEEIVEYEFVGGKAVPTHLFKVIIVENKDGKVLAPECYKMPNKKLDTIRVITTTHQKDITKKMKQSRENLEQYEEKIEVIQRESGLIFEEREVKEESKDNQRNSGLKEEITDGTWKMKWRAKERNFSIEVRVSGSYTDHSDRAVLH